MIIQIGRMYDITMIYGRSQMMMESVRLTEFYEN